MRDGNRFKTGSQIFAADSPKQVNLAWTTFIEHKGWTVIQSLMCAQGRTRNALEILVDIELLCVIFIIS